MHGLSKRPEIAAMPKGSKWLEDQLTLGFILKKMQETAFFSVEQKVLLQIVKLTLRCSEMAFLLRPRSPKNMLPKADPVYRATTRF